MMMMMSFVRTNQHMNNMCQSMQAQTGSILPEFRSPIGCTSPALALMIGSSSRPDLMRALLDASWRKESSDGALALLGAAGKRSSRRLDREYAPARRRALGGWCCRGRGGCCRTAA